MLDARFREDGLPLVRATVRLIRFDTGNELWLAVDTGAETSVLMPRDLEAFGLEARELAIAGDLVGVGGRAQFAREAAELIFDEQDNTRSFWYRVLLGVLPPGPEAMRLPSILGRDVINRWRMDYHPTARRLACEVMSADETIDLG